MDIVEGGAAVTVALFERISIRGKIAAILAAAGVVAVAFATALNRALPRSAR